MGRRQASNRKWAGCTVLRDVPGAAVLLLGQGKIAVTLELGFVRNLTPSLKPTLKCSTVFTGTGKRKSGFGNKGSWE